MFDYFSSLTSWQTTLKKSNKPIAIYGMGDGCQKVLDAFKKYDINCNEIFASDDFVRGQSFAGYKVKKLAELEEKYSDFTVVVAFGSSLPEIMKKIESISSRHTLVFPDTPVIGEDYFVKDKFLERFGDFEKIYSLLADEQSKSVFINVISFKITGNIKYLKPIFTSSSEAFENILKLKDREIYADLGAYTGDTISEFLSVVNNKYKYIYALEPNKKNFKKCVRNTLYLNNINLYNSPAWSVDTYLNFSDGAGRQAQIVEKGCITYARSLDSILNKNECTYIKYDVEGADAKAIEGSMYTLQHYSPKICTALYHRAYDILDIPLLLNSINPEYKLYMRQFKYYPAWETNLFATTKKTLI